MAHRIFSVTTKAASIISHYRHISFCVIAHLGALLILELMNLDCVFMAVTLTAASFFYFLAFSAVLLLAVVSVASLWVNRLVHEGTALADKLEAQQNAFVAAPERDLDLTVSTDFEDLACFSGDFVEFLQQDASLGIDLAWAGIAAIGAYASGRLLAQRLR